MNRRKFLTYALATGSAAANLPHDGGHATGEEPKTQAHVLEADAPSSRYYEFSVDGRECHIPRHDIPVPWMNLASNDRFTAWITHDGRILESCLINNKINRLTNASSGYLYLRDVETQKHFSFNRPYPGGSWRSLQGLGYTAILASAMDVEVSVTYLVPREDDILLWRVEIRNRSQRRRHLQLYSIVEWCLGDESYSGVLPGGDFHFIYNNFKKIEFKDNILFGSNYSWGTLGEFQGQKVWPYTGFFTSSLPVESFECHEEVFWGSGGLENPAVVVRGAGSSKPGFGFTYFPIGVLQNSLELAPDEELQAAILLGMVRDRSDATSLRMKYSQPGVAEKALAGIKSFWDSYLKNIIVETPDRDNDRLLNIWSKYQHRATMLENLNTGRKGFGIWCSAYPYGAGRSSDIRETGNVPCDLQLVQEDILDFLHGGPLLAKKDLELRWKPRTCSLPPLPYPHDGRSDWPYSVVWYLQETGDPSFLDTEIELNGQHTWMPAGGSATLFECMEKAIAWSVSGLSKRGLPRLDPGLGDWNDGLSLVSRDGRAESILTATELCYMLRECQQAAKAYGKPKQAAEWMDLYHEIKSAVNRYAWDGEWYIRAFTDEGIPIGSSRNKEGKIYLTVQAYAVLSGVAEGERAAKCLEAVDRHLMTPYGPNLFSPPYTAPDDHIGIAADFGPGWRENAGLWIRPCGWAIMANCVANRADAAFAMYEKACLLNFAKDLDRTWLPPFAYPEYHVGAGPDFARGEFQWCMGAAGTMWRAYVYYILGIRPMLGGLLVDPKIPKQWRNFKVTRNFRNASYEIHVSNPKSVSGGVQSMMIDGHVVRGNIIPAAPDEKIHNVQVVLGA